ncbi:GNAT family N-acetyltransferase [Amycolatopsis cynarae]|uniref:GNAT family N-acetyltransferase n=1 Tax=Amycolatopsis cynarae TaxID=2995223 RepID=A0ABY7AYP0_9PSEU|nr:GNAT family N-acetyltransferase [Amycolatopsis sp. HUAS 11-8]WAL64153.1 GNAT family N-acetyltransferase [Amycolatopsis sp. HUAS 11-8]
MEGALEIGPVRAGDRARWEVLARAYKDFYRTPTAQAGYDETWRRLVRDEEVHGAVARLGGQVVGIAHYLFHAKFWSQGACYLQDLYVDEAARGRGAARALIEYVADEARGRGLPRLYWHTQQDNATARALYDKVAKFSGFVRYERALGD